MSDQTMDIAIATMVVTNAARLTALKVAAGDVCTYCGERSLPNKPAAHVVHGPNSAGNYTHRMADDEWPCKASSIWARIRFEFGEEELSR